LAPYWIDQDDALSTRRIGILPAETQSASRTDLESDVPSLSMLATNSPRQWFKRGASMAGRSRDARSGKADALVTLGE